MTKILMEIKWWNENGSKYSINGVIIGGKCKQKMGKYSMMPGDP